MCFNIACNHPLGFIFSFIRAKKLFNNRLWINCKWMWSRKKYDGIFTLSLATPVTFSDVLFFERRLTYQWLMQEMIGEVAEYLMSLVLSYLTSSLWPDWMMRANCFFPLKSSSTAKVIKIHKFIAWCNILHLYLPLLTVKVHFWNSNYCLKGLLELSWKLLITFNPSRHVNQNVFKANIFVV